MLTARSASVVALTMWGMIGVAVAQPLFPAMNRATGGYWFPNPGTGQTNPTFDQAFDAFGAALGKTPLVRDMYSSNSNGMTQIAATQSWNTIPLQSDPRTAGGAITPIISLAMAAPEDAGSANAIIARFNSIAAGGLDAQWKGVVDAWWQAGFPRAVARLGYEMNGHWMAWAVPGGNKVTAWIAAFRHVSQVMKAEAGALGMKLMIAWNPALTTWEVDTTDSQYPGDDVVDIISLDIYSSVAWAGDLTNWDVNGNATGTAPDLKTWAASVTNRRHFWMYPDANAWDPQGASHSGWGLGKHIAFASAHHKRIAISETGVGLQPGAPDDGIDDDSAFPYMLWQQLHTYSFGFDHIVIWSLDEGDYQGSFLSGTSDPHPLAKAAWRRYFGDGANTWPKG